jgi:hypothetical protein
MYDKNKIDAEAEQEGDALKRQGRYKQTRYRWMRLQEEYKRGIERKYFKG